MTCMATYGNGAVMGMAIILVAPRPTLQDQVRENTAYTEAVVGEASGTAAVRGTATKSIQATLTIPLASALFLSNN